MLSLQGKDASKRTGDCLQLLMVLLMKEYLPISVLCFLVLIFRLFLSASTCVTFLSDAIATPASKTAVSFEAPF